MTKEEIEQLEKTYNEASKGTASPDYMEIQIPGIGLVQATNGGVAMLNGSEATPEEARQIAEWLNRWMRERR